MAKYVKLPKMWRQELLDTRENALVNNCITYADNNPAGLPGHNLMLIVAKLANRLDITEDDRYVLAIQRNEELEALEQEFGGDDEQ